MLIATNGALTERMYLEEVKRLALQGSLVRNERVTIRVEFINGETGSVLRKLSSPHGDTRDYDEVWVVVDEDGQDRGGFLRECQRKSTKAQRWVGIVSRPCFEVWLIAHYERVHRYTDQRDAQRHYQRLIPAGLGKKELPQDFPFDAVEDAVARCHLPEDELLGPEEPPPSPGSAMPHLVTRLGLVQS